MGTPVEDIRLIETGDPSKRIIKLYLKMLKQIQFKINILQVISRNENIK